MRLGEAVMLQLAYGRPRTGDLMHTCQAVRTARDQPFELKIGKRAEMICWGVRPSGMLRQIEGTPRALPQQLAPSAPRQKSVVANTNAMWKLFARHAPGA